MEYQLIKTTSEFDHLAKDWNTILSESITNVPFLRHEYLRGWWEKKGGGEWKDAELAIITATENDELIGIAPFFLTNLAFDGKKEISLMLLGGIEISDYLDLIVPEDNLDIFTQGLFAFLDGKLQANWQRLDLFNVPEGSKSIDSLKDAAENHGWEFEQEKFRPAVAVKLPGDFDEYLAGIDKKQRHEIRRKLRRAAEFYIPVTWNILDDETQLEAGINDFLSLMALEPEKDRFLTSEMREQMKILIRAAWDAGWLQLSFLEVGEVKAAAYLNFDYNGTIWVYNSGMDPRFNDLSPGWVLLGHLLWWANEQGRSVFDFMRGDERYKFKFGGTAQYVQRIQISRN
jgi:CelD/BcsL family acetyltransferase involved in cellulose biosynthesis